MSNTFNTTKANWQGVDDVPTAGSENLVKSGGVEEAVFPIYTDVKDEEGNPYSVVVFDKNKNIGVGLTPTGEYKGLQVEKIKSLLDDSDKYSFAIIDKNNNIGFALTSNGTSILKLDDIVKSELFNNIIYNLPITNTLKNDATKIPVSSAVYQALYGIYVWAPKKIYALDGTIVQLFKNSIVVADNQDNYELRLKDLVGVSNSESFGYNFDFCYEYAANGTNANFGFTLAVYDSALKKEFVSPQGTTIISIPKKSSPASMKNVLCIGDSFTDADIWVSELRRLLTGEVSSGYSDTADSSISADSLTNINFIGTKDTGANQTPNEGWNGQHYRFFAGGGSKTTSSPSPFVNPNTNTVDFDYYMGTGDVKGSIQNPTPSDKIDFAIIVLGTNGGYEEQYVKAIWDGLLSHNSNVKVIIAGRCMPVACGVKANLYYRQTYCELASEVFSCNSFLEGMCERADYVDNFLYVDYNIRMDILNNMPLEVVQANIRNSSDYAKIKRGQNNVHPNKEGYFQMADAFRGAFHYWFL